MNEDEAMEYLKRTDLTRLQVMGGDPATEAAVVTICRSTRDTTFLLPVLRGVDLAHKPRAVIGFYASKHFVNAARDGDVKTLGHALTCLEVSNLRAVDRAKANAMLDRYIVMVGTLRAETALREASRRATLSEEGRALIHDRLEKLK